MESSEKSKNLLGEKSTVSGDRTQADSEKESRALMVV